MGSLLEGIDTSAPADKSAKAGKSKNEGGSETAKTFKLAIAIGGLLIGGVLIAWNMGLFHFGEVAPNSPQAAASSTAAGGGSQQPNKSTSASANTQQNDPSVAVPLRGGPQTFKK